MKKNLFQFKHTVLTTKKSILLLFSFTSIFSIFAQVAPKAVAPILGNASTFAVFGGNAGITNQGINTITHGSIGTVASSASITGFHDGVTSAIYTETGINKGNATGGVFTNVPAPGDATSFAFASLTLADANTAFNNISPAAQPGGIDPGAGELGGLTLKPGVYKAVTFNITNVDLTLDAEGDENAVWVFQSTAALTVGIPGPTGARSVKMINGGLPRNVYWYVGSAATINGAGGGVMIGTILAYSAITFSTAGNAVQTVLNGRALSLNASVTMVNTTVNAVDTWTGLTSTAFTTATNWSTGATPISSEEVLIPNVTTNKPLLSSSTSSLHNLTLYSGAGLTVTSNLQVGGFINNLGNLFAVNTGTITMNGTLPQILPASTFTNNNTVFNLTTNNATGVSLGGDIIITNLLTLSNGLINTGTSNLVIANNVGISGASASRYINGNLRKVGTQAFTFPVGNLGKYAPISISAPINITDHFTVSYAGLNANALYPVTSLGTGLNKVSSSEYWMLNRTNGTSNVNVTLSFETVRSGTITTLDDLRVASWNGTQWVNQGNSVTTGNGAAGTITSNAALSSYGAFTIGTSTANNTLPINLTAFSVQQQNNAIALQWNTSNEINAMHFIIQRSIDGNNFSNINKVIAKGGGDYSYSDSQLPNSTTVYYRLQMVDKDGSFMYSKVIAIDLKSKIQTIKLYPNPVVDNLFVQFSSVKAEKLSLIVTDLQGRIMQQFFTQVGIGNVALSINTINLPKGSYVVVVKGTELKMQKQFVK